MADVLLPFGLVLLSVLLSSVSTDEELDPSKKKTWDLSVLMKVPSLSNLGRWSTSGGGGGEDGGCFVLEGRTRVGPFAAAIWLGLPDVLVADAGV